VSEKEAPEPAGLDISLLCCLVSTECKAMAPMEVFRPGAREAVVGAQYL